MVVGGIRYLIYLGPQFWSNYGKRFGGPQVLLSSLTDTLRLKYQALRWRRPTNTVYEFQRILGNHPQHPAVFSEGAQQSDVPFVSGLQQALSA